MTKRGDQNTLISQICKYNELSVPIQLHSDSRYELDCGIKIFHRRYIKDFDRNLHVKLHYFYKEETPKVLRIEVTLDLKSLNIIPLTSTLEISEKNRSVHILLHDEDEENPGVYIYDIYEFKNHLTTKIPSDATDTEVDNMLKIFKLTDATKILFKIKYVNLEKIKSKIIVSEEFALQEPLTLKGWDGYVEVDRYLFAKESAYIREMITASNNNFVIDFTEANKHQICIIKDFIYNGIFPDVEKGEFIYLLNICAKYHIDRLYDIFIDFIFNMLKGNNGEIHKYTHYVRAFYSDRVNADFEAFRFSYGDPYKKPEHYAIISTRTLTLYK